MSASSYKVLGEKYVGGFIEIELNLEIRKNRLFLMILSLAILELGKFFCLFKSNIVWSSEFYMFPHIAL